jgi:hypothetical protein
MNSKYFSSIHLLILAYVLLLMACNKNSNELVVPKSTKTYDKTLTYNGTTFLTVQVTQKMSIGEDSLKLFIRNPTAQTLIGVKAVIYFQTADTFDSALDMRTEFEINNLSAGEDTTIYIFNKPSLPVSEDRLFIKLLAKDTVHSHIYAGIYDGQAAYYFDTDTIPSKYSFMKGIIEADGTCSFWMKLNSENKKLSGQFIDTTDMNGLLIRGSDHFNAQLDTFSANQKFIESATTVMFPVKITPIQADLEKKIRLTLYK